MTNSLKEICYEVELDPGEVLALPPGLLNAVGPGKWIISVAPLQANAAEVRGHDAFLRGYGAEDEGLYDDLATR